MPIAAAHNLAFPPSWDPQLRSVTALLRRDPKGTLTAERRGSAASRLHQSSLHSSGLASHGDACGRLIRRTAVIRTRMPGGVGGVVSREAPIPMDGGSTVLRSTGQEGALRANAQSTCRALGLISVGSPIRPTVTGSGSARASAITAN